jgi:hypothetical protein
MLGEILDCVMHIWNGFSKRDGSFGSKGPPKQSESYRRSQEDTEAYVSRLLHVPDHHILKCVYSCSSGIVKVCELVSTREVALNESGLHSDIVEKE